jgi:transcription-repair coupling factor (superfamily II helicase)
MSITASAASSGLRAIEAAGAPHDCLEIHYAGGDKLFLPVENIELLSRYGSEETTSSSTGWRRRLAGAQGAHEEPHPRDRQRADQDRRRAAVARGAALDRRARALRRVLRRLSLRGDRRPAARSTVLDELASGRRWTA